MQVKRVQDRLDVVLAPSCRRRCRYAPGEGMIVAGPWCSSGDQAAFTATPYHLQRMAFVVVGAGRRR